MATLGYLNQLEIVKLVAFGAYLDGGDMDNILLPARYLPKDAAVGDEVEVFVYLDSDDRPVATTETPKVMLDQCALLEVVDVNSVGAFLDWGLSKDLLVPYGEQATPMRKGQSYVIRAYMDPNDGRLIGSSKLDKHLAETSVYHKAGQSVSLRIAGQSKLGYKAIVDEFYIGLLFFDEAPPGLEMGEYLPGFIKAVRSDGKLDLTTRAAKPDDVFGELSNKVLQQLIDNDGVSTITDKSSPADILKAYGVSKSSYKKTIGHLLKLGKISITREQITLL